MPALKLSVGDKPGWERTEENESSLKTVAESGVVLYALRQSRDRLIFKTFPRFASRSGKIHPPSSHTLQRRARCNVEIGPHSFDDVAFYEVHYQDQAPAASYNGPPPVPFSSRSSSAAPPAPHSAYDPQSSNATPYPDHALLSMSAGQLKRAYEIPDAADNQNELNVFPSASQSRVNSSLPAPTENPAPVISEPTGISQSLIQQVAAAAAGDERLRKIVAAASQGTATTDQLRELSKAVRELKRPSPAFSAPGLPPPNPPKEFLQTRHPPVSYSSQPQQAVPQVSSTQPTYATHPSVREFDIVIEFSEAIGERFTIPRGPAVCQLLSQSSTPIGATYDIELTVTTIPKESDAPQLVELHLTEAPSALWDTVRRWVGDEVTQERNRAIIEQMKQKPPCYLAHQLKKSDPLLSRIQSSINANSSYPMRNIAWDQNFGRAKRPRVQDIPATNASPVAAESAQGKRDTFRYAPPGTKPATANDTAPSVSVWRASTPNQTARSQEKRKTNAALALADIQRGPPPCKSSAPASASPTPTTALPVSDVITLVRPYEQSATSHRPGDYHDSASEVVMHVSPRRLQGAPESTRGTGPAGEAQAPPTTPYAASSTSHTAPSQTADGSQSYSPNAPNPVSSSAAPPAKRQRRDDAARSSLSQTSPVRCFSCQRTDVPLIMAARFCRQCVESGRAVNDVPPEPKYIYSTPATYASQSPVALRSAGSGELQSQGYGGNSRKRAIPASPASASLHAEDRDRSWGGSSSVVPVSHVDCKDRNH
ncbi:hypothetical protein K525DRAFT_268482 [Schizophyllum commune Loenen D]|nr:hypothetical protein K525DRAFT_268482 [Schizophyllum commune Loenen D]